MNNKNNINNNNNRYLEMLPIKSYIAALTKLKMHNKQQNLSYIYSMFQKHEKKRKA